MATVLWIDNLVKESDQFKQVRGDNVQAYMFFEKPTIRPALKDGLLSVNHKKDEVPEKQMFSIPDDLQVGRLGIVCHGTSFINPFIERNLDAFIEKHKELTQIDFFACNTLTYDKWNAFYNKLKLTHRHLIIGASNDDTGNMSSMSNAPNWIMENLGEGQDIKSVYFTDDIKKYVGKLDEGDYIYIEIANGNLTLLQLEDDNYSIVNGDVTGELNSEDIVDEVQGIPYNITEIKSNAFISCYSLTSISGFNTVETIESYAFVSCGLTSISGFNAVETIGSCAFYGCYNLTSISGFNALTIIESVFLCPSVMSLNGFSSVHTLMLTGNQNITSLTGFDEVETIESNAFADCIYLTTLSGFKSVKKIESAAFSGCLSLTTLAGFQHVRTICSYAFSGCENLTTLDGFESVKKIEPYAFSGCTSLAYIGKINKCLLERFTSSPELTKTYNPQSNDSTLNLAVKMISVSMAGLIAMKIIDKIKTK